MRSGACEWIHGGAVATNVASHHLKVLGRVAQFDTQTPILPIPMSRLRLILVCTNLTIMCIFFKHSRKLLLYSPVMQTVLPELYKCARMHLSRTHTLLHWGEMPHCVDQKENQCKWRCSLVCSRLFCRSFVCPVLRVVVFFKLYLMRAAAGTESRTAFPHGRAQ